MRETVPSVIAAIDPGQPRIMSPILVTPEPLDVIVVVGVVVGVVVIVIVVVIVASVVIDPPPGEAATIAFVRMGAPHLVQRDMSSGPDLEAEHPHDHRDDRQHPTGVGAERASRGGVRHGSVRSILLDKRTVRKARRRSFPVRAPPTRGSARVRAHSHGDPPTRWSRSVAETPR
jgi:hypothetical protein